MTVVPAGGRPAPTAAPAPTVGTPVRQIADDLDLTIVVPALQDAFGDRFGGFWIDPRSGGDVLHVGVVGATPDDAAAVGRVTGGHPGVVTDPVELGYDELLAAQDEVARSLAGTTDNVAVTADVATSSVVVQPAADNLAEVAEVVPAARAAARRGVTAERAKAPTDTGTVGDTRGGAAPPAPDPATAVVVEPDPTISITPAVDRLGWRVYEAGLLATTASSSRRTACTSGFTFHHARWGYYGSTAGHCNPMPSFFGLGHRWIGGMAANKYYGVTRVAADVSMVSLTANRVGISATIRSNPSTMVDARYANSQLGVGLRLCFDGVASDTGNCGTVVRANEWLCCDSSGHWFLFTCINYPSASGDSGAPVYQRKTNGRSVAAGMVSSSVVINGQRLTCFTTVQNIENQTNTRIVLR